MRRGKDELPPKKKKNQQQIIVIRNCHLYIARWYLALSFTSLARQRCIELALYTLTMRAPVCKLELFGNNCTLFTNQPAYFCGVFYNRLINL